MSIRESPAAVGLPGMQPGGYEPEGSSARMSQDPLKAIWLSAG